MKQCIQWPKNYFTTEKHLSNGCICWLHSLKSNKTNTEKHQDICDYNGHIKYIIELSYYHHKQNDRDIDLVEMLHILFIPLHVDVEYGAYVRESLPENLLCDPQPIHVNRVSFFGQVVVSFTSLLLSSLFPSLFSFTIITLWEWANWSNWFKSSIKHYL